MHFQKVLLPPSCSTYSFGSSHETILVLFPEGPEYSTALFLTCWNPKGLRLCLALRNTKHLKGFTFVFTMAFCFISLKKFSCRGYLLHCSSQHAPNRIAFHNKPIHLLACQKFLKLILIINMINTILYFSCCCKIIGNKYRIVMLTVLGRLVPNGGSSQLYFINNHIGTVLLSFS